jgi:hypothetical protein
LEGKETTVTANSTTAKLKVLEGKEVCNYSKNIFEVLQNDGKKRRRRMKEK